jgi:hypothetical protein
MLEMTADNPATESAPTGQDTATGTQVTPQNESGEELQGQELEQSPELDEIEEELEGVKLRGRKEALERIKAERLMQQDYTRKTMSHAEERRAFESERESFTRERQVAEQLENERFHMRAIDTRMQQIAQALPQVSQQNPELAQQLRDEFMQLQGVRPRLEGSIAQKQQQRQLAQQQTDAKLFSDAQTFLMREIKDWSPAKDAELEGYAKGLGINTQQLGQFLLRNPAIAVALDKAQKWDKSVKERLSTIKKPAPAPDKPASRIEGGKAKTQKSVSDMSPAEYREFRRKSAGR